VLRSPVGAAAVLLVCAAPASGANPWLGKRVLNMAHQGGEDELPSNTMCAFERTGYLTDLALA
jgi:glycerophosphoryl diester phosphodiesterase